MRASLSSYLLFFIGLGLVHFSAAQDLKELMVDPSINFYEVVDAAEKHFAQKEAGEGSGRKGFERWRNENEPRFYPSGDRSQTDFYFAAHQFQNFLAQNPESTTSFTNGWRDLGPYQVGEIRSGYSPGLGRVECFYVNPADTNTMYLGSRSGGFWKTSDGGATWSQSTTDTLIASGVNTMSVSPNDPDSVLINVRNASNGTSHGIYRSVDAGNSWTVTPFNPQTLNQGGLGSNFQVYKVKYHPLINNRIYVGTSNGLYISKDNLQTFTQVLASARISDIAFHPTDTGRIYVYDNRGGGVNENKIQASTDGGYTFTPSAALASNNRRTLHLSISDVCPSCVYAASDSGVYVSTDYAATFTRRGNPPRTCDGFAVSDQDTSQMIYGMLDIYRTDDGGWTFTKATQWNLTAGNPFNGPRYVHADLREAASLNGTFYAATDGFLVKTHDYGITWQILSFGTGIRENYAVGVSQSDTRVSICGSQDNGTSVLAASGWVEYFGADGMEGIIHPLNPDFILGSYQFGGRIHSKNGGYNTSVTIGNHGSWEAPLHYDPLNQMSVYSFGDDVHLSDDFGENWNVIGGPTFAGNITQGAIAQNDSRIMAVSKSQLLQLSRDGGQTFSYIQTGLPVSSITDIAFAPHNDSIIVVTYSSYQNNGAKVYMTTDQGASWQNITGNLGDMPLRAAVIDHTSTPHIYVGAEIGVFARPLSGGSWQLFNTDLPNCSVRDLEVMWGTNTIRAATWGRGLWEADLINHQDHPKITRVELGNTPDLNGPRAEVPQPVVCEITYANALSQVYIRWGQHPSALDSTISCSLNGAQWESDRPLPGITLDSNMYFQVVAVGSNNDTSVTYPYMYKARPKVYCNAAGRSGTGADWIAEVKLNDLQNTTVQSAYSDFTSMYANLEHNKTYIIEVQLNASFSPDSVYAWIDYDQNYDFSDRELIRFAPLDPNHKTSALITTPSTVGTDTLRMRVRNQYDRRFPEDCGSDAFGEVEDYSIILKGATIGQNELTTVKLLPEFYPNPAEDHLFVQVPAAMQELQLELVDLKGGLLQSWSLNSGEHELGLQGLEPGVYLLRWNSEGQEGHQKLILR